MVGCDKTKSTGTLRQNTAKTARVSSPRVVLTTSHHPCCCMQCTLSKRPFEACMQCSSNVSQGCCEVIPYGPEDDCFANGLDLCGETKWCELNDRKSWNDTDSTTMGRCVRCRHRRRRRLVRSPACICAHIVTPVQSPLPQSPTPATVQLPYQEECNACTATLADDNPVQQSIPALNAQVFYSAQSMPSHPMGSYLERETR